MTSASRSSGDARDSRSRVPPAVLAVGKVVAGNGSYVALGFVANIVSANGLSPSEFGVVSLCLATLNVLQEIGGNGIDLTMVRLAAPHVGSNSGKARGYYRAALQYKLFVNLTVALLLWFLAPLIGARFADSAQMSMLLHWVCGGLIGATLYNYALAILQAEERFSQYALLRIVNNVAKLLILGVIWILALFNPTTVLAAWMSAFFFGYVLSFALRRRESRETSIPARVKFFNADQLSEVFHYSKWLVGSSLLFTLYSRTDMLILSQYASTEQVGQYAAAWNITYIIDLMTYSVIIALLPKATRLSTGVEFGAYLKQTFLICMAIAVLLSPMYIWSGFFFTSFFPAYVQSSDIFRILFLGAIVTLLFHPLYLILYARNRVNLLTLVNFLLVIFSIIIGLQFIPEYGITGAAYVTVAGRLFASLLIVLFVFRELKVSA